MDKELLKKIPYYVGMGLAFVVGLLFAVLGDLKLNSSSFWLIGGVLLTFGGVACLFLSDNFKEKKVVMWILKGVGLAMICAFIGYAVGFHNAMAVKWAQKPKFLVHNDPILIVMLVFSCLSVVAQIIDIVFTAVIKEK